MRLELLILTISASIVFASQSNAASVGADGGITLWVSYDDSGAASPLDIDDTVSSVASVPGGSSCGFTNDARTAIGAPDSPGQCPGDAASCTGREKVTEDITRFAEWIFQSTEGANYLRRVYVADEGRSWDSADVRWNMNTSSSFTTSGGWKDTAIAIDLQSAERKCIHDVLHHEFGHYFHRLPDRYARDISANYYRGRIDGGDIFPVGVTTGDPNTVMSSNFPHVFVDESNASITVEYTPPGGSAVTGEVLTPDLLNDADPDNDGPDRAHSVHTMPFAQDEWSFMPTEHASLSGAHTTGNFPAMDFSTMPAPDIVFIGDDAEPPGTVLLLDRSGSMSVQTDGVPASQYVQEAGLYLYHSSRPTDFVGTYLYNANIEELFEYAAYDPNNALSQANFRPAQGLTDIALALETAIDELVGEHTEAGVNGANIVLMSDGKQTTGASLWDQVDRANMMGIRINTFSFGNADAATMDQIATDTSGGSTVVSEREEAFELKIGMAREFSEIRGYTPVHSLKERLLKKGLVDRREVYEGRFTVPPRSRDLQFYSFLEGGTAASFELELIDPSGNLTLGTADSIAVRGRFNGIKAEKPEEGVWTYRLKGTRDSDFVIPSNRPFELTAYVLNPDLHATLNATRQDAPAGAVRVEASAIYRYPLADITARLHIFRAGDSMGWVELYDDGQSGGDYQAGDGIYSGILDLGEFGLDRPLDDDSKRGKTRLDAQFLIGDRSRPAPNAHYESGTDLGELTKNYEEQAKSRLPFEVWTTRSFDFTEDDRKGERKRLRPLHPRDQQKALPGGTGKIVLAVFGIQPRKGALQISLGQGVDVSLEGIRYSERRLGGRVELSYAVSKDAREGARDLILQMNDEVMRLNNLLFVVR